MRRGVQVVGVVLLGVVLFAVAPGPSPEGSPESPTSTGGPASPEVRAVLAALDAMWTAALPRQVPSGPRLVVGRGTLRTSCGPSPEDEGSFYCGEDRTIYLQEQDLSGLAGTPTVQEASRSYLLAHEYGHYLQHRLEVPEGDDGKGPRSDSVHYELQADCLAGVFVATRTRGPDEAAYREAVRLGGDDVGEDPLPLREYEHGSGEQRTAAFVQGLRGSAATCLRRP